LEDRWPTRNPPRKWCARSRTRTEVNKSRKSRIRTFVRKVEDAVESRRQESRDHVALKAAEPEIMRGVTRRA
jgi:small subunit ribosomal protein S20